MIAHEITMEWSDGAAELLALDFATGRIIVRWGSGWESCTSGYCFDRARGSWSRFAVPFGYRVEALVTPAGDRCCRDLGLLHDEITARPVFDELACSVAWLREHGEPGLSASSAAWLRAVASWLLAGRSCLLHGFALLDALSQHGSTPVGCGGGEVDDLLGALVRAEVLYPNACEPDSRAPMTHDTQANLRGCFAGRFVLGASVSEWGRKCVGAKHWLYQRGPRWEACVGVRGGY